MTVTKPLSVRALAALAWIRIVAFALLTIATFVVASPFETANAEAFRRGFIKGLGYSPEAYGPAQMGEIVGSLFLQGATAIALLVFLKRRRLKWIRGLTIASALVAMGTQPSGLLLSVPMVILAYRKSMEAYCAATQSRAPIRPKPNVEKK